MVSSLAARVNSCPSTFLHESVAPPHPGASLVVPFIWLPNSLFDLPRSRSPICWRGLLPVFAAQVLAHFGLQLTVVIVDGGPQSSLSGISLGQSLQNALQVAHVLGVDDKLHRRERLV